MTALEVVGVARKERKMDVLMADIWDTLAINAGKSECLFIYRFHRPSCRSLENISRHLNLKGRRQGEGLRN